VYLKDFLSDAQVALIVEKDPSSAAKYLKDRLSDDQVTLIIEKHPSSAAEYLNDRLSDEQRAYCESLIESLKKFDWDSV
jgi:DNA-binding phage protein